MKKRMLIALAIVVVVVGALLALQQAKAADCVPQSVLTWVDNRESIAISPTRWQNVRKTLLGQDDGMSLDDMEVIYNRRVSNGWEAGHWVPIIDAVKCLQAPPPVVEVEEAPPQPLQAEVEEQPAPAQETPTVMADLSQPPAAFFYFDDKDEVESGGETWSMYGHRTHHEWIRPDGGTVNARLLAWNEWGPWDDLPEDVQQSIHESVGQDHLTLASSCGGFNATGLACSPLGENLRQYNLDLQKWTWRGDFVEYTLHPKVKATWDINGGTPEMVFEYDPNAGMYDKWFAYVEYTRADGRKFSADHWYAISFEDGAIRGDPSVLGPGKDGLSAQFYRKNDYFEGYADNIPSNSFLIGEVRRSKIIGTFVTGVGQ